MAPSVLARGPVLCGLCGQEFSTEQRVERWVQADVAVSTSDLSADDQLLGHHASLREDQPHTADPDATRPEPDAVITIAPRSIGGPTAV